MRFPAVRHAHQFLPFVRACVQVRQTFSFQVKRLDIHSGKGGRGHRQRGPLLYFQPGTDYAAAGTPECMLGAQQFAHRRGHAPIVGLVVWRHEGHRQLRRLPQLAPYGVGAVAQGAVQVGLLRYGRRPFHLDTSCHHRNVSASIASKPYPQPLTLVSPESTIASQAIQTPHIALKQHVETTRKQPRKQHGSNTEATRHAGSHLWHRSTCPTKTGFGNWPDFQASRSLRARWPRWPAGSTA